MSKLIKHHCKLSNIFFMYVCIFISFTSTRSLCPPGVEDKLVSVICWSQHAVITVNHTLLTGTVFQNLADEFSGLIVYSNHTDPDSVVPPMITTDDLSYNTTYSRNPGWSVKDDGKVTTLAKHLLMEVMWPVQENGDLYSWTLETECRFNNQLTVNLDSVLRVDSTSDSIPVIETTIQSAVPANEPIPIGTDVTFELRIPNTTNAIPVDCGITTDEASLNVPSSPTICYFWQNGAASTSPCANTTSIPPQTTFTSNYYILKANNTKMFTTKWSAFESIGEKRNLYVFCTVRVCTRPDDIQCNIQEKSSDGNVRIDVTTWMAIFRQTIRMADPPTTPLPTSAPLTVPPPTPRQPQLCMKSEVLGSALGVPFAVIVILLITLLVLLYRLNKQTKQIYADRHPKVTVAREMIIPRPQITPRQPVPIVAALRHQRD